MTLAQGDEDEAMLKRAIAMSLAQEDGEEDGKGEHQVCQIVGHGTPTHSFHAGKLAEQKPNKRNNMFVAVQVRTLKPPMTLCVSAVIRGGACRSGQGPPVLHQVLPTAEKSVRPNHPRSHHPPGHPCPRGQAPGGQGLGQHGAQEKQQRGQEV